jgi:transglutaminase-like putative cysteine protease
MNARKQWKRTTVLLAAMLCCCMAWAQPVTAQDVAATQLYYGIEINDVLCGYAEFDLQKTVKNGREILAIHENVFALLTALGSSFNTRQTITYDVDLATGNFLRHSNDVEQGDTHIGAEYVVDGDVVYLTPLGEEKQKSIDLPQDVILPNTVYFPHLKRDFVDGKKDVMNYKTLQVRDGVVQDVVTTRLEDMEITVDGRTIQAFGVEEFSESLGLRVRMWIDPESAMLLRAEVMNRTVFRADADVVKRVKVADLDEGILVKTETRIADVQGISAMKVRARMEPVGAKLTEEGLNGPGQRFTGSVRENMVEGVFEISHARYDGTNAPPFPTQFSGDPELLPYLEASALIEADDAVLAGKARRITVGAADAWEAATRLSAWVAHNIAYAIPGGGTARKTYDVREGECGAHSLLLAAFCRTVGIPARVVWGCMYTPNLGGSFGQHAWNEIYMGEAGWIPVDATAMEVDFVDSGHLRVGEMESTVIALNAKDMEILDYRLGDGSVTEAQKDALAPYCGGYTSETVGGKVFEVSEQNGKLALQIPDKMTLIFNEPDENGIWPCQLSPKLMLEFTRDGDGEVSTMAIMEENRMPRVESEIDVPEDMPEELRPLLGSFELKALKAQFEVLYSDGHLTLKEPRGASYVLIARPDEDGFGTEDDSRRLIFARDDAGKVIAMVARHRTVLEKKR